MMHVASRHFISNEKYFDYSVSKPYIWVYCFECFLHISNKLGIKKCWLEVLQIKDTVTFTSVAIRAAVHKILIHSTEVIKTVSVAIGQPLEEAYKARNKDCRVF